MSHGPARTFQDLVVWRKAHQFVLGAYRYSATFPKTETYGLTSQLRRAAVSIPANIVEGFRRLNATEKLRFYNMAQASLDETHYFLILANDLEYGPSEELIAKIEEVRRLLDSYVNTVRTKNNVNKRPPDRTR